MIEIGNRKGFVVSRQDLESKNWKIDLLLQQNLTRFNPHSVISPKDLADWKKSREFAKSLERINLESDRNLEKIRQQDTRRRLAISQALLADEITPGQADFMRTVGGEEVDALTYRYTKRDCDSGDQLACEDLTVLEEPKESNSSLPIPTTSPP